ncbi:unnamed protein product [Musa hybrid cultivar]
MDENVTFRYPFAMNTITFVPPCHQLGSIVRYWIIYVCGEGMIEGDWGASSIWVRHGALNPSSMVEITGTGVAAGRGARPWRLADEMHPPGVGCRAVAAEHVRAFHRHEPEENQCSSAVVRHIRAPVHLVWSLVRKFDEPQKYKPFVSRCIAQGDLGVGRLREVNVKSGLPATTSTERLEHLDDTEHILSFKIVGGDHRLKNYSSIVTAHPETIEGKPGTLVIESFVVDVPDGNTKDETCYFVEALIKCNLKSLAEISERLALQDYTEPVDL